MADAQTTRRGFFVCSAVVRAGGNPKKLNLALFHTAQLHMRFGALMAVGLGLNWLIESL